MQKMKIVCGHSVENSTSDKEILKSIIDSRNIENIDTFLNPPTPLGMNLSDFGISKKNLKSLLERFKLVKNNNEKVVVYTDYDADGITGGAILWETLHLLGFDAMPYVPHRSREGYGFSKIGIDNVIAEFDPKLIISVDHGITAKDTVIYAKSKNIDIIVTDHHHKQKNKIPGKAIGIFHIPALSGSGVAYFVAKELFNYFGKVSNNFTLLAKYFNSDYLALASIGTVADLVPLVGPSRSVVTFGLRAFKNLDRIGLREIISEAAVKNKEITPYEIGFVIAPRINAIGRLDHAIDALRLLCTTSNPRAKKLAEKIGKANEDRRTLVDKCVKEAIQKVTMEKLPKLIIIDSKNWHEGIIGLIASKMVEEYFRPCIVMTKSDRFYKASVRSIPGFHVTDFLSTLGEYLAGFGGHAAAAGFTIEESKKNIFIEIAQKKADKLISDEMLTRSIIADIDMPISMASKELVSVIDTMYPFGIGNPKPKFVSEVIIDKASIIGKNKTHLKLLVSGTNNEKEKIEMIAFGYGEIYDSLNPKQKVRLVYQLGINNFRNNETLQGVVKHIEF